MILLIYANREELKIIKQHPIFAVGCCFVDLRRYMLHPINDRLKIKVDKDKGFLNETKGTETGIVVEVPDVLMYLSFHSFAFEHSFGAKEDLQNYQKYYNKLIGKRVFWEELQDRGRRIKDGDEEFIFLQMTDVLAYSDPDSEAYVVNQTGSAGSFNL